MSSGPSEGRADGAPAGGFYADARGSGTIKHA